MLDILIFVLMAVTGFAAAGSLFVFAVLDTRKSNAVFAADIDNEYAELTEKSAQS